MTVYSSNGGDFGQAKVYDNSRFFLALPRSGEDYKWL